MKKMVFLIMVAGALIGCGDQTVSTERRLDSLEQKIETRAEKLWDSTKAETERVGDKLEEMWEERKDSADNRSTNDTSRR